MPHAHLNCSGDSAIFFTANGALAPVASLGSPRLQSMEAFPACGIFKKPPRPRDTHQHHSQAKVLSSCPSGMSPPLWHPSWAPPALGLPPIMKPVS